MNNIEARIIGLKAINSNLDFGSAAITLSRQMLKGVAFQYGQDSHEYDRS